MGPLSRRTFAQGTVLGLLHWLGFTNPGKAATQSSAGVTLIARGRPAATLVTSDQPSGSVHYAATELGWHIKKRPASNLPSQLKTMSRRLACVTPPIFFWATPGSPGQPESHSAHWRVKPVSSEPSATICASPASIIPAVRSTKTRPRAPSSACTSSLIAISVSDGYGQVSWERLSQRHSPW